MKKLFLIICTLLLTLSVAACGGKDSDLGGLRGQTGKKKTLTYLVSAESTAYKNILNDLLAEFNESVKDEGYEIIAETPGGEYYQSLGNKFAANKAPDIFMMEIGYFNAYKPYMASLNSYIEKSEVLSTSDLWDLNDNYKDNGEYKALIKDFSPDFMLIYNKTMLNSYNAANPNDQITISETEPLTWVEFYEIASKIQNSLNVQYGTSLGFEGVKHLHQMVQSTGASMYTSDYKELNIGNSNVKKAFEYFCALQKDNATEFSTYMAVNHSSSKKAPASYTSGSNTSEQELFKQQRCFSIFNGLYSFISYDFYNTSFEVGIAPSPVMNEGDDPYSTTSAMVAHGISRTSKYKDIAWRWLEFYQTEGLKRFAAISFNIPGNKTVAGSDAFLKNDNPKIEYMTNYFYNYVNSGYVYATQYNPNVSFSRIRTCFSTHMAKYYDGQLSFNELLTEINKSVKASV